MAKKKMDSFKTEAKLKAGGKEYSYASLPAFAKSQKADLSKLPYSIKILLENMLRHEDGETVTKDDILAVAGWQAKAEPSREIQYRPARILLQDFTGVPAVADLAAMRAAVKRLGGDPSRINPLQQADLVIDHSVQVDFFGTKDAVKKNTEIEYKRNRERYEFLRWGQNALKNFRVVPPETGIVHQVNLEFLSYVAMPSGGWLYPDSLIGTDSHTTMINGLGVLGWGVGGIEAEAAMLGQPVSMLIPQVVGMRLKGALPAGTTATDLVLTVTQVLRKKGVVEKFVEFFGPGLENLTLADRATLANMAPEYGATCGLFPVDERTTEYLALTNRKGHVELVEKYFKAQGMWFSKKDPEPEYSDVVELDLSTVRPSLAGPSRPQDRVPLDEVKEGFRKSLPALLQAEKADPAHGVEVKSPEGKTYPLSHGSVVITAITSCTNTSNPAGLMAAGLLAKKASALGLKARPWVKTSLAPGSKVVTSYLVDSGLMKDLEAVGFYVVGYGCTTCIGNSGPLPEHVAKAVQDGKLAVAAVLSGNRNFEGRINPHVRANYLASPALVVAYALAGNMQVDLTREPLGEGANGKPVYLKDIWPTGAEIETLVRKHVTSDKFEKDYASVFEGNEAWRKIEYPKGDVFKFEKDSTYIKEPPFFEGMKMDPSPVADVHGARALAMLKDSVTTDHISPAGDIKKDGPAGRYLMDNGVDPKDFNSFGARRGNHEVMIRGTFANVRLKNQMVPGVEGGVTKYFAKGANDGKQTTIYEAAEQYKADGVPLVICAGKEYGTGSSRDWAAKGTLLLGVRAVIAQSFERIHRSNLVGMGVLPLVFEQGKSWESLGLDGTETFDIGGVSSIKQGAKVKVVAKKPDGRTIEFPALARIDTPNELEYFRHGGILPFVLRQILKG